MHVCVLVDQAAALYRLWSELTCKQSDLSTIYTKDGHEGWLAVLETSQPHVGEIGPLLSTLVGAL